MLRTALVVAATTAFIGSVDARGKKGSRKGRGRSGSKDKYDYAYCILQENPAIASSGVSGTIKLRGDGRKRLQITTEVSGLNADQDHGFHIHAGPFDNEDCKSSDGHFNPLGYEHGAFGNDLEDRHVGDMKQLEADGSGVASYDYTDIYANLDSSSDFFVGGNAMTVHALTDDLGVNKDDPGSTKGGNAGDRWACCNITICSKAVWDAL